MRPVGQSLGMVPAAILNPRAFKEGATSTAGKITTFVVAILAAIASFFLLPAEVALLISAGLAGLLTLFSFLPDAEPSGEERRWYHPVVWAIPNLVQQVFPATQVQPVVNQGRRVVVEGGHQPAPVTAAPQFLGYVQGVPVSVIHPPPRPTAMVTPPPIPRSPVMMMAPPPIHPVGHQEGSRAPVGHPNTTLVGQQPPPHPQIAHLVQQRQPMTAQQGPRPGVGARS